MIKKSLTSSISLIKNKDLLNFEIGQHVVFCPVHNYEPFRSSRGADGIVISKETKGKHGKKKKLLSILVKWLTYRKGVSCFRIKGKARAKSDTAIAILKSGVKSDPFYFSNSDAIRRFEEKAEEQLHDISYCHDCPLRLKRLVSTCDIGKRQAILKETRRTMGKSFDEK